MVACFLFSLLFLSFWQEFSSQDVLFGGMAERLCHRRGDFGPFFFFFFTFFFDFGSQIYTSLPISDYHAAPSLVPRRLPPLLP
jgi:hypothetical protein